MKKFGLTGNIASGKSEVANIIEDADFCVYDLDRVVHALYDSRFIKKKLLKEFSVSEKKIISKIVFSDKNKLKKLEEIIHPCLRNFISNLNPVEPVFISGALLFEGGFDVYFDKIIYVTADFDLRLERLIKRDNLTPLEAEKRLLLQNEKYKNKADFVIENNSSIEDLKAKVEDLLIKLQNK